MRGLARNRKTAMRTHSRQRRACQDNKGWDKVYTIKQKKCNLAFRSGPLTRTNRVSPMGQNQQRSDGGLVSEPTTMVRVAGLSAQIWTEMRQTAAGALQRRVFFILKNLLLPFLVQDGLQPKAWFYFSSCARTSLFSTPEKRQFVRHRRGEGCEVSG